VTSKVEFGLTRLQRLKTGIEKVSLGEVTGAMLNSLKQFKTCSVQGRCEPQHEIKLAKVNHEELTFAAHRHDALLTVVIPIYNK